MRVAAPNDAELGWIADHLGRLAAAGVDVTDAAALGAHYDELLTGWLASPRDPNPDVKEPRDPNPDINLIGLGLGEHLRRRTILDWAVVTDAHGTEMALHGRPGEIVIYPANAVAKRWVAQETGFLPAFVEATVAAVSRIASGAA
jgi:hypothetical protein